MLQLKHTTRIHVRYMYFEMLFSARNELYFFKRFFIFEIYLQNKSYNI